MKKIFLIFLFIFILITLTVGLSSESFFHPVAAISSIGDGLLNASNPLDFLFDSVRFIIIPPIENIIDLGFLDDLSGAIKDIFISGGGGLRPIFR